MKSTYKVWDWAKNDLPAKAKSIWGLSLELGQRLELAKELNHRLDRFPLAAKGMKQLHKISHQAFGYKTQNRQDQPQGDQ